MELREIEEKADELAISLLATDSKNMAMLYGMQLEGLKDLSVIKAARDRRHEWNASVGQRAQDTRLRERELAAMETAAAAADRATSPGPEVYLRQGRKADTVALPEPIKTAADRLHELVSYFQGRSDELTEWAERYRQQTDDIAKKTPDDFRAESYTDAAEKLQEILTEGGI